MIQPPNLSPGARAFPVYHFSAMVARPIPEGEEGMSYVQHRQRQIKSRPGWMRETFSNEIMIRSMDASHHIVPRFWRSKIDRYPRAELERFSTCYLRHDTWVGVWFSHWTFDIGQSDEQTLASFQEYVDRWERYNRKFSEYSKHGYEQSPVQLMGAEDRWRWSGSVDGEEGLFGALNTTDPPCRCDGCQSRGVIRICH